MYKLSIVLMLCLLSACGSKAKNSFTDTQTTDTLSIGELKSLNLTSHGSIGLENKVTVDNSKVLKIEENTFEYDNEADAEFSGGDSGTDSYVFKALSEGEATITIKEIYRGELKEERKIKIMVVKPQS